MSELKPMKFFESVPTSKEGFYQPGAFVDGYLKSEVDKVIKNITEGAMSMFREANRCRGLDTKSPLGRIADVAFKHWNRVEHTMSNNRQLRLDKAELLRSNEYLRTRLNSEMSRRLTDKLEYDLNIRHHKYRRCLAMAKWCEAKYDAEDAMVNGHYSSWEYISKEMKYWERWGKRWLELAEQFKEGK